MEPILLLISALVALLLAVLDGWLALPSRGKPSRGPVLVVLAAAVCPAALVLSAPVPSTGFEAIVFGLPSCAQPVMSSMLARVDAFACGRRDDGTLDLACLCRSKPFKTEAKRAVGEVCHDPAEIGAARKWAIARCTAVLLQTSLASGAPAAGPAGASTNSSSSSPSSSEPVFSARASFSAASAGNSTTTPVGGGTFDTSSSSSVGNGTGSTPAMAQAVFDIDDDEDWTAGAGMMRPAVAMVVVLAVSVGVMLL